VSSYGPGQAASKHHEKTVADSTGKRRRFAGMDAEPKRCAFWPAQGIEAEIPQTPQPLAIPYLLLCRDPPIGVQRGWGRDRENIWNSLPSAFSRSVLKIAEADSTSIFPGFFPGFFPAPLGVRRTTYGMGRGIEADSPVRPRKWPDAPKIEK
jgi:hypothetical protein